MNALAASLVIFSALLVRPVLAEDQIPSIASKINGRLREDFKYTPLPATLMNPSPAEDVVLMESYTVRESIAIRNLARIVEEQNRRIREEEFTFVKGGTLLKIDRGGTQIEIGAWGDRSGLKLLKLSW